MAAGDRQKGKTSRQGRRRLPGFLQALAITCFLCMTLIPLLMGAFAATDAAPRCSGDHRICGCSPQRVADKTCCCFRVPDCCKKKPQARTATPEYGHLSPPAFSHLPCGRQPAWLPLVEDLELLLPTCTAEEIIVPPSRSVFPDSFILSPDPSFAPPVPPPRNTLFA